MIGKTKPLSQQSREKVKKALENENFNRKIKGGTRANRGRS